MIISFLISILIPYGFVLIVVRAKITEFLRTTIKSHIETVEKYLFPSQETITELLVGNSSQISEIHLNLHAKIIDRINKTQDTYFPELTEMLKDLKQKIQTDLIRKRNTKINKIYLFLIKKFDELINCPMCLGFWVGICLACILAYNPIILFNQQIIIISSLNPLTLFLWGCLTSGTTWAIDQFIEYFSNNQNS